MKPQHCLCYITMNIESIVSTIQACIVYCVNSKWYITRDLLYFIYVYTYGHSKRWWILRTLYLLSFVAYRFTWILSLLSLKGLKCTFAFYDFYHVSLHEMCCMYHHIILCIAYYTCFVRNHEIKMSNLYCVPPPFGHGNHADENLKRGGLNKIAHDDVIKWKHFPRYWPFVRGIHRSPGNSSHKGQWRGALMFSLICVWIIG